MVKALISSAVTDNSQPVNLLVYLTPAISNRTINKTEIKKQTHLFGFDLNIMNFRLAILEIVTASVQFSENMFSFSQIEVDYFHASFMLLPSPHR
jgi:hypothetical protein